MAEEDSSDPWPTYTSTSRNPIGWGEEQASTPHPKERPPPPQRHGGQMSRNKAGAKARLNGEDRCTRSQDQSQQGRSQLAGCRPPPTTENQVRGTRPAHHGPVPPTPPVGTRGEPHRPNRKANHDVGSGKNQNAQEPAASGAHNR